jgi:alkylation response protein AidB-like acyl-CoA dehydrogenase
MNFGFTEEQELLRAEVRKFLDESCPMENVRKISASPQGYCGELWKRTAALGWPGLTIPEAHGGAGLGFVDLVVLLEETGRTLHPSPLIATTLAAAAILDAGSPMQKERWLPALASGSCIGSVALLEASDVLGAAGVTASARREGNALVVSGEKRFVPDGDSADLFVVACRTGSALDDLALVVIERGAPGLFTENLPCIDATKRLARLRLDGVRVAGDAVLAARPAAAALARLLDRGAAAVTAEMIGASEGALQLTVRYAKERVQFGSPIGRYQGVKHPLAEIYVDVESSKSLLYFAAWALDESPDEAPRAVSMAKAYATETFSRLGLDVVQLHGGIGYTWEYDAQLYLKRSKWARPTFGDAAYHYERTASLGGL